MVPPGVAGKRGWFGIDLCVQVRDIDKVRDIDMDGTWSGICGGRLSWAQCCTYRVH
jgi:hypothetical protein